MKLPSWEPTKSHHFINLKWASQSFLSNLSLWHVMKWDTAHWLWIRGVLIGRRTVNGVMGSATDGADGVPPPLLRPSPVPPVTILSRLSPPLMLQSHSALKENLNGRLHGISIGWVDHLITQETDRRTCREVFNASFYLKMPDCFFSDDKMSQRERFI